MRNHNILAIILLALLLIPNAWACSVLGEPTIEENYSAADHVALVRIMSTHLVPYDLGDEDWLEELVEARYEVIEEFKGSHDPPVARELVYGPGNCMLGLATGNYYLLFLSEPGRIAGWPGGSTLIFNLEGTEIAPIIEQLRDLRAQ